MIHSSYKSLFVAVAVAMLGVGCAIPSSEGDESAQSSEGLAVDHAQQVKPELQQPNLTAATAQPSQQNAVVVHPDVPKILAGPKPNPWDDNSNNTGAGTGSGTGGSGTNTK